MIDTDAYLSRFSELSAEVHELNLALQRLAREVTITKMQIEKLNRQVEELQQRVERLEG